MHLSDLFDPALLDAALRRGLVREVRDEASGLRLLDYTQRTQSTGAWDEATSVCRGLVVHEDGTVVARPFPHMADLDQLAERPPGPVEATDKVDGSLVIHLGGGHFATRGSFRSAQARHAEALWHDRYGAVRPAAGETWLFEVVYPGNRIVVDHGDLDDLVLLAVLDVETGADVEVGDRWPGPRPRRWPDLPSVDALPPHGPGEGFVVRFADGTRAKVKSPAYRELHGRLTRTTERTIWEVLRTGGDLEALVAGTPPAFIDWVGAVADGLEAARRDVERRCRAALAALGSEPGRLGAAGPRQVAARLADHPHRDVLLAMAGDQPYDQRLWRAVRPAAPRPFRPDGEGGYELRGWDSNPEPSG